jgi:hypothetical protein
MMMMIIIIIIISSSSSSSIITILVITLMQGIYTCIPEKSPVSRVHSIAAVQYLQFLLPVMLFHLWKVLYFYIMCAVPKIAVFFCGSLILCFPGVLHKYCLYNSKMVPVTLLLSLHQCIGTHALHIYFWILGSFERKPDDGQ